VAGTWILAACAPPPVEPAATPERPVQPQAPGLVVYSILRQPPWQPRKREQPPYALFVVERASHALELARLQLWMESTGIECDFVGSNAELKSAQARVSKNYQPLIVRIWDDGGLGVMQPTPPDGPTFLDYLVPFGETYVSGLSLIGC